MQPSAVSVFELLNENLRTLAPFLDLGNCGLNDSSSELLSLNTAFSHLKAINLGKYYYTEGDESVYSKNQGEPNVFTSIPRSLPATVEKLYLNIVSLEHLDGINAYEQLQFIDLFGNNVSSLRGLRRNENLLSFGISNNKIRDLDGLQAFPNLQLLYIGQNSLEEVDGMFMQNVPALRELFIYKNGLKDLDFLRGNTSLLWLEAQQNSILNESRDVIQDLIYLEVLNIGKNPVAKGIPKELLNSRSAFEIRRYFKKLSPARLLIEENKRRNEIKGEAFLDLGNCGLTEGDKDLELLRDSTHLQSINLGSDYFDEKSELHSSRNNQSPNSFKSIPAGLPEKLRKLQIRHSTIDAISNIHHLKELELLDLSFNLIELLHDLSYLPVLHELALHNNRISSLSGLDLPDSLRVLHLSANKIESLKSLKHDWPITQLILYNNRIREIAPLLRLKSLKELSLDNNPIEDCPSEIAFCNDVAQIRTYFSKEKKGGTSALSDINDVKLIIIGNSNTGKTNLVHYLEKGAYLNKRVSTHGLEVKRWKPDPVRFPRLKNVEVSTWDFGGQEYYHDAYKLFLSNDAVYIILWSQDCEDSSRQPVPLADEKTGAGLSLFDKGYWLDTVNYFTGKNIDTPVILVQNKVDKESDKRRVDQTIHESYGISESFHISLQNGVSTDDRIAYNNMASLTSYLEEKLLGLSSKNAQFSEDFKRVRAELLKLNDPGEDSVFQLEDGQQLFIEMPEFIRVCKEELGIANDIQYYPTWLHRGGTVVYFEDSNLQNYIFVNPRLLSQRIYSILEVKLLEDKGEILKTGIEKDEEVVIDVMKKLALIYDHPMYPDRYLAPQYLPEHHPIEELFTIAGIDYWRAGFWVRLPTFYYKKLMHYLLIYFTKDKDSTAKYFWKNGIIFQKDKKRIFIKGLSRAEKEGIIEVKVEDGHVALQKEVFRVILDFNVRGDAAKSPMKANETLSPLNPYLENLWLSVDNSTYDRYHDLKRLAEAQQDERQNTLIKYRNVLPFAVGGIEPKNIFVSYSHNNTVWLSKIRNHLAGLKRGNYIKEWTDQEILPGESWDKKISEQLAKADIYILLLSAEFIASDYSWDTELREIFTQKVKLGKQIIPIYVEYCDLGAIPNIDISGDSHKINDFEIIPKDESGHLKPISIWPNEAQALSVVAARVREAVMGGGGRA